MLPANETELQNTKSATTRNASAGPKLRKLVDNQRSEFLRRCRARVHPESVGLPQNGRARNGGLRREDVAMLAGVSTSWYTWLEQGRDIRVSDEVLERISQALQMSADERVYLFSLVQQRLPRLSREMRTDTPADVDRMIQQIQLPAVAMNLRCDILSWNAINSVLYRDYADIPVEERNLIEILLIKPSSHLAPPQMEAMARRLIGRLRFDYSKCAGDPKFDGLIRRMLTHSPIFNRLWRIPDFSIHSYGLHQFNHVRFGPLAFEHSSYIPDGHQTVRVVVCTPADAVTRKVVAQVNQELAAAAAAAEKA